jgi:hypothetical protein
MIHRADTRLTDIMRTADGELIGLRARCGRWRRAPAGSVSPRCPVCPPASTTEPAAVRGETPPAREGGPV